MADILVETQTEEAIASLTRGAADDRLRDRVSAALLRSQTKVLEELRSIKENLWDIERLERLIDKRHGELCSSCPLRAKEPESRRRGWLELLVTSESLRYFLLMAILIWAIVYVKSGPDCVKSVAGGVAGVVKGPSAM